MAFDPRNNLVNPFEGMPSQPPEDPNAAANLLGSGSNQYAGTGTAPPQLNEKLKSMGLDPSGETIKDPNFNSAITTALKSVNDPAILQSVKKNLKVDMPNVNSLGDFLDINKIKPTTGLGGQLSASLSGIGSKLGDLGASFKNVDGAKNMFNNIEVPEIPTLNAAGDLPSLMGGIQSDITGLTGTGNGFLGVPNMRDFFGVVSGSSKILDIGFSKVVISEPATDSGTYTLTIGGTAISGCIVAKDSTEVRVPRATSGSVAGGQEVNGEGISTTGAYVVSIETTTIDNTSINAITAEVDKAESLFTTAGIDLTAAPTPSLSAALGAGTKLHKYGATNTGGVADILKDVAKAGSQFGDAIKSSLAEGKNKITMAAAGIKPPDFSGMAQNNPFSGLPAGGSAEEATANASKLLGG